MRSAEFSSASVTDQEGHGLAGRAGPVLCRRDVTADDEQRHTGRGLAIPGKASRSRTAFLRGSSMSPRPLAGALPVLPDLRVGEPVDVHPVRDDHRLPLMCIRVSRESSDTVIRRKDLLQGRRRIDAQADIAREQLLVRKKATTGRPPPSASSRGSARRPCRWITSKSRNRPPTGRDPGRSLHQGPPVVVHGTARPARDEGVGGATRPPRSARARTRQLEPSEPGEVLRGSALTVMSSE